MSGRQGLLRQKALFFKRYSAETTGRLSLFAATFIRSPLRSQRFPLVSHKNNSFNQLDGRIQRLFTKPLAGFSTLRCRTRIYRQRPVYLNGYIGLVRIKKSIKNDRQKTSFYY